MQCISDIVTQQTPWDCAFDTVAHAFVHIEGMESYFTCNTVIIGAKMLQLFARFKETILRVFIPELYMQAISIILQERFLDYYLQSAGTNYIFIRKTIDQVNYKEEQLCCQDFSTHSCSNQEANKS